MISGTPWTHR